MKKSYFFAIILLLPVFGLTQEIKRPTTNASDLGASACGGTAVTFGSLTIAKMYDSAGESTAGTAAGPSTTASVPRKHPQVIISGWQTPTGPYAVLSLKVRSSCTAGTTSTMCAIQYSTDGSAFGTIRSGNWTSSLDSVTLSLTQNFANLKFRYCVESAWDTALHESTTAVLSVSDIRTEGILASMPLGPTNFSAVSAANGISIALSWTDNATNETGFRVERCSGAGCTSFAQVADLPANTTSVNDPVSPGTTYRYRVYSYNANGTSYGAAGPSGYGGPTGDVTTPTYPAAPTGASSSVLSQTRYVVILWTDNATTETGYKVQRCSGAGCSNFTDLVTLQPNSIGYQDNNAPTGTYNYRVYAYNAVGNSGVSNVVSATVPQYVLGTPTVTTYQYDVLGNLTLVNNAGQFRNFQYDAVSRLKTATNPESGTINYQYDSDSNVTVKTDARGQWISYCYDSIHRLEGKRYNATCVTGNGLPNDVGYIYDTANGMSPTFPVGRRTGMRDPSGTTAWAFNEIGGATKVTKTIGTTTRNVQYAYNNDGSVASITYPSARVMNYTYNNAGQPISAVDPASNIAYAKNASYAPSGALLSLQRETSAGVTGFTDTFQYNNRLQPTRLQASATSGTQILDLQYFYFDGANNGNIREIKNNRSATRTWDYTYDELNRIKTATRGATVNGNQYSYDVWGNMQVAPLVGVGENFQVSADPNTNRLVGYCYDAAGNMLNDSACGANKYAYDTESRLSSAVGTTYTYDGDGTRVKKSSGTIYWTGAGTDILAEGTTANGLTYEYVFFGGKRLERINPSNGGIQYYFSDHLGSSSAVMNASVTVPFEESDYYPFGREITVSDQLSDQNYKFTGKERDVESGLDDFGARFYSSVIGRFVSPDSTAYSSLTSPRAWNLYIYTLNNPLRFVDLNGHAVQLTKCNSVSECQSSLDQIAKATGVKDIDRKRLYPNFHNGKYFVGIKGDPKDFAKLSNNAAKLERMVSDTSRTVQYYQGNTYAGTGGAERKVAGGFSGTPSEGYDQPFVAVDPNPQQAYDADDLRGVMADGSIGQIPPATPEEVTGHELLGHVYSELYLGHNAGTLDNLRDAVISEDEVRNTDPARGLKIRHGGNQVVKPSDLDELKKKP